MRLLTLFLTCVLSMGIHAQDSTIKQKLEEIDNAIAHSSDYVAKREARITEARNNFATARQTAAKWLPAAGLSTASLTTLGKTTPATALLGSDCANSAATRTTTSASHHGSFGKPQPPNPKTRSSPPTSLFAASPAGAKSSTNTAGCASPGSSRALRSPQLTKSTRHFR